jgi:hypothetical protein
MTVAETFAEGFHYVDLYGATSGPGGQSVTWHGDANGLMGCRIHVMTQG